MMEQEKARSLYDVFASSQETFEEAKKKSNDESGKRITFYRMAKDGTYTVRILPLAPQVDKDGNFLPLERKGYEYPLRSLILKIADPSKTIKGKPSESYVNVCNAKHAFPSLEADLIDTYVKTACEKYASDEALCKKLREGSFSGGLKWDSRRCMYIYDLNDMAAGIQILSLSYSQYKDLEERKLNLWTKLNKTRQVPCPISSVDSAYPIEVVRKTEGGKASYSFNIDTVAEKDELTEENLQTLIDSPRLPEMIYRFSRYHLEAEIVFLQQLDEKFGISVMNEPAIENCIAQIKLLLPADDNSHFVMGGKSNGEVAGDDTLEGLWNRFDKLEEEGKDDDSDEGQELRANIKEFIEANELDVVVNRRKTNSDLLTEISALMENQSTSKDNGDEEKTTDDGDDMGEDDEPSEPQPQEIHTSRRTARPTRRRE